MRLLTALFALSVLVVTAGLGMVDFRHIGTLMRDVTTTAGVHPLVGAVSNLGAFLWMGTASACAFAAAVLHRRHRLQDRNFLLAAGGMTLALMIDDFFLVHDWLAPRLLKVSEPVILMGLAVIFAAYLTVFRRRYIAERTTALLAAIVCFTISVAIDAIDREHGSLISEWTLFAEDGFKWLGIVFWSWFHVHKAFLLVDDARPRKPV